MGLSELENAHHQVLKCDRLARKLCGILWKSKRFTTGDLLSQSSIQDKIKELWKHTDAAFKAFHLVASDFLTAAVVRARTIQ